MESVLSSAGSWFEHGGNEERQTPGLQGRIPTRIIFKLYWFICVALGGTGQGRGEPECREREPPRCANDDYRSLFFLCLLMSVCQPALCSEMISEGSWHSSLVIGLRGGRIRRPLCQVHRRGRRPAPRPLSTSNGTPTNQSAFGVFCQSLTFDSDTSHTE